MAVQWVCIALVLSAASASNLNLHDPVVISQPFLAGSTDPTAGSTAWALTSHGISEKLFTVDKDGQIVPQVAQSIRKISTFEWEVTLKSDYKFSNGDPVLATNVADALTALNTHNSGAQASLGSMTVTSSDAVTLKIVSERATPVMDAVLAEWPFVVYLEKSGNRFFTGPYKVETFVTDDRIELAPNTHYPRAVERPLLVVKKWQSGESAATKLEAGEIDMAFHLPVDTLTALRAVDNITVKTFPVGYQYMMFHNIRKTSLMDVKVRKAVDMAIDRSALTQETRGGQATRSLFPKDTPWYLEEAQLHADKNGANALLDEAGWAKNANGIREKDGVQLTIDLVAYPQRPGLVMVQPLIAQSLTSLGMVVNQVTTSADNWDELDAIIASKNFDLMLWAQNTLPAGDPQWFINAFFRSGAGNNHAGLNSSEIDDLIDALSHADAASRVSSAAAAHRAIHEQVPVSIVMTPAWHVGLGSRVSSYEPWGSDYYVIRPDFGIPSDTTNDAADSDSMETEASGANWVSLSCVSIAVLLLASMF